jgi:phosphonopyruvate decarboxylase
MGIPYRILPNTENEAAACIKECYAHIKGEGTPFALIARKGTFAPYQSVSRDSGAEQDRMAREQAIEEIIRACSCGDIFVSTTGMASRELYELREKFGAGHARDFLTVGSMGHASSLALALALQKPRLPVNCIDGDGAALMHLGALAAIGARKPANLRYFLLNNGAHDSVGGQPTIAPAIDFTGIARSAGFRRVYAADTPEELRRALRETAGEGGPVFIEIKVRKGSRAGLGRPRSSPGENKEAFMRFVAEGRND